MYLLLYLFFVENYFNYSFKNKYNNNTKVYGIPVYVINGQLKNYFTNPYYYYSVSKDEKKYTIRFLSSDVFDTYENINKLYDKKIWGLPFYTQDLSYGLSFILAHEFSDLKNDIVSHVFSTGLVDFSKENFTKNDIKIRKIDGLVQKINNVLHYIKKEELSKNAIFLSADQKNDILEIQNKINDALNKIKKENYTEFMNNIYELKHTMTFFGNSFLNKVFSIDQKINDTVKNKYRFYSKEEYNKSQADILSFLDKTNKVLKQINYVNNIKDINKYKKNPLKIKTFNYNELDNQHTLLYLGKINQNPFLTSLYDNNYKLIDPKLTDDFDRLLYFPLLKKLIEKIVENFHEENLDRNLFL